MNLGDIMLREVSQSGKNKCCTVRLFEVKRRDRKQNAGGQGLWGEDPEVGV